MVYNGDNMKPVKGYEEYFSVTEEGRIYSHRTNRWLKLHINKNGYVVFASKIGGRTGKAVCLRVHRCVAETYISNPENKPEVNHKDGNKTNNSRLNLEWCTTQENSRHAHACGLIEIKFGTDRFCSKLSESDVQEIRQNRENKTVRQLGEHYNVDHSTIVRCKNKETYSNI
jgi:hypothetical protein